MTTETKKPEPLDFNRVDALRKHMLMTASDMASILGVSRVTYYNWTRGKKLRSTSEAKVRRSVRKMLHIIRDHDWPSPEILSMTQPERKKALAELISQYE